MNKKSLVIFSVLVLMFSMTFVSAGFWDWLTGDTITKTTEVEGELSISDSGDNDAVIEADTGVDSVDSGVSGIEATLTGTDSVVSGVLGDSTDAILTGEEQIISSETNYWISTTEADSGVLGGPGGGCVPVCEQGRCIDGVCQEEELAIPGGFGEGDCDDCREDEDCIDGQCRGPLGYKCGDPGYDGWGWYVRICDLKCGSAGNTCSKYRLMEEDRELFQPGECITEANCLNSNYVCENGQCILSQVPTSTTFTLTKGSDSLDVKVGGNLYTVETKWVGSNSARVSISNGVGGEEITTNIPNGGAEYVNVNGENMAIMITNVGDGSTSLAIVPAQEFSQDYVSCTLINGDIVSVGYRTNTKYCNANGQLIKKSKSEVPYINIYECQSGMGVDGICSRQTFRNWFNSWWF